MACVVNGLMRRRIEPVSFSQHRSADACNLVIQRPLRRSPISDGAFLILQEGYDIAVVGKRLEFRPAGKRLFDYPHDPPNEHQNSERCSLIKERLGWQHKI